MTIHKGRDLTEAVVATIESDGWVVGEGVAPDADTGVGWAGAPGASTFTPYVVVYPTPGGMFDGTISDPSGDVRPDYIIHSVAATQEQCQIVDDRVFAKLTSTTLSVAGRRVQMVRPDVGPGVVRDDDAQPPIFYAPARWRIWTTST